MTVENQRANVAVACAHLAPLARRHELVISHGNGPQIGLLALEGAAYKPVPAYPLDVLGAETQGMIGYLVQQELANLLPPDHLLATLLTMIEVDPGDSAFDDPTKPIGPVYDADEADGPRRRAWLGLPPRRRQGPSGGGIPRSPANPRAASDRRLLGAGGVS